MLRILLECFWIIVEGKACSIGFGTQTAFWFVPLLLQELLLNLLASESQK